MSRNSVPILSKGRRIPGRVALVLILVALTSSIGQATDHTDGDVTLTTDRGEYYRLNTDTATSTAEITFTAPLDRGVILSSSAPFWVSDARGHTIYFPPNAPTLYYVPPGGQWGGTWDFTTMEDYHDAASHGDVAWSIYTHIGLAAPGTYTIYWEFLDGDDPRVVTTTLQLHEGLEA